MNNPGGFLSIHKTCMIKTNLKTYRAIQPESNTQQYSSLPR